MKVAKPFILQLRTGYHILAYVVLISGRVGEIRGLGVGATECVAVGILPRWFKGVLLAGECLLYRSIHAHYSAAGAITASTW